MFLILHNISLDQIRLCMLVSQHYPLKGVFAKHEGGYAGLGKVTLTKRRFSKINGRVR